MDNDILDMDNKPVLMRTVKATLPTEIHLLPFGKHALEYPNRDLAAIQFYSYLIEVIIAALTLCFK